MSSIIGKLSGNGMFLITWHFPHRGRPLALRVVQPREGCRCFIWLALWLVLVKAVFLKSIDKGFSIVRKSVEAAWLIVLLFRSRPRWGGGQGKTVKLEKTSPLRPWHQLGCREWAPKLAPSPLWVRVVAREGGRRHSRRLNDAPHSGALRGMRRARWPASRRKETSSLTDLHSSPYSSLLRPLSHRRKHPTHHNTNSSVRQARLCVVSGAFSV
jgi:hypothetical protein